MTTTITRLYKTAKSAKTVVSAIIDAGLYDEEIDVIDKGVTDDATTLETRVLMSGVWPDAAPAYVEGIKAGNVLVVARAPFGYAKAAIEAADKAPSVDVGVAEQERLASEVWSSSSLSILADHPLFLTEKPDSPYAKRYGVVSRWLNMRILSDEKKRTSAVGKGGFMSTKFLPFPLLLPERKRTSALGKWKFTSQKFLPFPLLVSNRNSDSAVGKAGTPFSTTLGIPLLTSRR